MRTILKMDENETTDIVFILHKICSKINPGDSVKHTTLITENDYVNYIIDFFYQLKEKVEDKEKKQYEESMSDPDGIVIIDEKDLYLDELRIVNLELQTLRDKIEEIKKVFF